MDKGAKKKKRSRIRRVTLTPSIRLAHYSQHHRGRKHTLLGPPIPLFAPLEQGTSHSSARSNSASTCVTLPDLHQADLGHQRKLHRGKYEVKKKQELNAWLKLRQPLMEATVGMHSRPNPAVCRNCNEEDEGLYRCTDCQPVPMCRTCLVGMHPMQRLHVVEQWQGDYFTPVEIKEFKYIGPISTGGEPAKQLMTLIDHKGRSHANCTVLFNDQEGDIESLVRLGFWPATPSHPKVAVSMELLDMFVCLTLEAQVSVQAFVSALKLNNSQDVSSLRHLMRGECVAEYRIFWQMMRDAPQSFVHAKDMDITCPACPRESGFLDLAMDANFGLVHKMHSGKTYSASPLENRFFLDQVEVDEYVTHSSKLKRPDQECSQFQAATAVRTKNKAANLTVTGVFGSVCRHEVPFKFTDMRHGERLGYSVCIINHALVKLQGTGIHLHVLYDIACILQSHLQKGGQRDLLSKVSLAIPVFHAYGHKGECQVLMNPRRMQGFGLTDGEQLERLWSYLRLFAKISKEQTPGHRRDLLVMALSHYASIKIEHIETQLVEKYNKAVRTAEIAIEKAAKLFLECHGSVGGHTTPRDEMVARWEQEERTLLSRKKLLQTTSKSWQDEYATDLGKFYAVRSRLHADMMSLQSSEDTTDLSRQLKHLDQKLLSLEKNHKIDRWELGSRELQQHQDASEDRHKSKLLFKMRTLAVEKEFLLGLIKKYAHDGQAVANRLSAQMKRVATSLRAAVKVYNRSGFSGQTSLYPNAASYTDICSPTSQVYVDLEKQPLTGPDQQPQPQASQVSASIRRQMLDTVALQKRAEEEQDRLRLEMGHTHAFYEHKLACTQEQWASITPTSVYLRGLQSLFAVELVRLKKRLRSVAVAFNPYVTVPQPPEEASSQACDTEDASEEDASEGDSDAELDSPTDSDTESDWDTD